MIPINTSFVAPDLAHEEKVALLLDVCKDLIPQWSTLSLDDIEVTPISGGISNMTLKFAPKDESLSPLAVKLFGDKTEVLVDRDRERLVLQALNKAGFGAKVYGFYENGRIEEFLYAKTLAPEDMSAAAYLPRIAERLHTFHQTRLVDDTNSSPTDTLFATIKGWLAIARELTFPDTTKQEAFDQLDLDQMARELDEIEAICAAAHSPVVFSHNDLLSGNILVLQPDKDTPASPEGTLQFIDFEYSDYCCRGFDFGNHFNEFAGFDCDYSLYPSDSLQKEFFTSYLAATGEEASDKVLDNMVAEANVYSLASHMYWGVWALVQARYSAIDFDYLEYSKLRWDQYYKTKDGYVQNAKLSFM